MNNPIYSWYVNGVEVPGEHMGVITLNMPLAGAYGFAAKLNSPICGVSVQSEPDTVYVFDALPLTITGDNVVCQNASATMTATNITNATYAWAGPDPAAATTTTNALTTTIPGVYAVTATMSEGCFATAEFTVYQFGGDLQVTADQMNVCPGTPVILNANLDGWFNENIEYLWSDGLGSSSTVSDTVNATTTYYVTASVTNVEGHSDACQLSSSITINAIAGDTIETTVAHSLGIPILAESNHMVLSCVGQQAFFNVSSDPNGLHAYIWYVDGVELPGENLNSISLNFNEAGNHTIQAKAVVSGCDVAQLSDPIAVLVMNEPEITISGNNVICDGNEATLTAVASADLYNFIQEIAVMFASAFSGEHDEIFDYDYAWSNGTSGAELTTTEAGVYTVTATYATGCVTTASIEVTTFGGDLQVTADQMHVCPGTPVTLLTLMAGATRTSPTSGATVWVPLPPFPPL